MTTANEMNEILDRLLQNTRTDGDMETLRQWLQTSEGQKFAQQITQPASPQPPAASKYNFTIGNIKGDVQFGDRTYYGTDAETLKNLITSLQKESQAPNSPKTSAAVRKILVIAASPEHEKLTRLNLEKEVKEIDYALRLGRHHDQFKLEQRWGVSRRELQDILLDIEPDIVHFCGHGAGENGLVLQDENQKPQVVSTTALTRLFESINKHSKAIPCIVLNACYSEEQADAMYPFIDYIVGMKEAIGDKTAIEFSRGFYRALSNGLTYAAAYDFGCNAIDLDAIPEHLIPKLTGKAVPQ
jgi:hypothetical protein